MFLELDRCQPPDAWSGAVAVVGSAVAAVWPGPVVAGAAAGAGAGADVWRQQGLMV